MQEADGGDACLCTLFNNQKVCVIIHLRKLNALASDVNARRRISKREIKRNTEGGPTVEK